LTSTLPIKNSVRRENYDSRAWFISALITRLSHGKFDQGWINGLFCNQTVAKTRIPNNSPNQAITVPLEKEKGNLSKLLKLFCFRKGLKLKVFETVYLYAHY
jgi:hypothetical protein